MIRKSRPGLSVFVSQQIDNKQYNRFSLKFEDGIFYFYRFLFGFSSTVLAKLFSATDRQKTFYGSRDRCPNSFYYGYFHPLLVIRNHNNNFFIVCLANTITQLWIDFGMLPISPPQEIIYCAPFVRHRDVGDIFTIIIIFPFSQNYLFEGPLCPASEI